jgi:hypothetical protein
MNAMFGMRRLAIVAMLGALSLRVAGATSATIDDSGTLVRSPTLQLRWNGSAPQGRHDIVLSGTTLVQVRLNLTPWLRRVGRIYLVFPAQLPGVSRASWTTQGRLLPGQVVSGGRCLVYSGPIGSAYLEDQLQLSIAVDARQMQQNYTVSFRFEMEPS